MRFSKSLGSTLKKDRKPLFLILIFITKTPNDEEEFYF